MAKINNHCLATYVSIFNNICLHKSNCAICNITRPTKDLFTYQAYTVEELCWGVTQYLVSET